jgi:hypothetical protein
VTETAITGGSLERLRELISSEGEALAPALGGAPGEATLGRLVAACGGGRADAEERALILESVLEGYLLHYGSARVFDTEDEDLRLLAGDYMYAFGLSRLARLGDLDAVSALADLISQSARYHATGWVDGDGGDTLAALWVLTGIAVGGGRYREYEQAQAAVGRGDAEGSSLREGVMRRASELGVMLEARHALIAFPEVAARAPQT